MHCDSDARGAAAAVLSRRSSMEPPASPATALHYTLALILPDAVRAGKASEIQQLAEMAGFCTISRQQLQMPRHRVEEFYEEHRGRPFFAGLVDALAGGPVVAMVLARADAVRCWQELMGPSNPHEARAKAPKSLRALYGGLGTWLLHGSGCAASAAREIKFFFPRLQLDVAQAPRAPSAQEYIAEQLQPVLTKALTVLAREKPSSDPLEALAFLAAWLRDNSPDKPTTQPPPEQQQLQQQQRQAAASAATAAVAQQQCAVAGDSRPVATAAPGGGDGDVVASTRVDAQAQQDAAATKVQAVFRGHQARLQATELRGEQPTQEQAAC